MNIDEAFASIVRAVIREELQARTSSREMDPLVSCADVGVPRRTWIGACRRGELKAIKIGRELRARRSEVDRWLASLPSAAQTARAVTTTTTDEVDAFDRVISIGRARATRKRSA